MSNLHIDPPDNGLNALNNIFLIIFGTNYTCRSGHFANEQCDTIVIVINFTGSLVLPPVNFF